MAGVLEQLRRRSAGPLLALATVTLALLLAELALRLHTPLDAGRHAEFRIPHPVYGWLPLAGASYLNTVPDRPHRVTYNSRGFRDVEHEPEKQLGRMRIALLGDSFMEGYSVPLESSFHQRLQAMAAQRGWEIEVINLGVGGYGTLQQYLVLRDTGWLYEPDVVLIAFFGSNDLRNNSFELERTKGGLDRKKTRSRPYLEPGGPDEWNIRIPDFESAVQDYERHRRHNERLLRRAGRRFALARLIADAKDALSSRRERPVAERKIEQSRRDLGDLGEYYCTEPPEFARAWEATERILARLKNEADERGVPVVVFSVPAEIEVEPAVAEARAARTLEPGRLCIEEALPNKRLGAVLESLDIRFVDLLGAFRVASRDEGVELFGHEDPHWNTDGHDLAAGMVLEALLTQF